MVNGTSFPYPPLTGITYVESSGACQWTICSNRYRRTRQYCHTFQYYSGRTHVRRVKYIFVADAN